MLLTSAIDGCRIDRVPDAGVEIIEADPANRAFPDRVNESLGICLKLGPEHDLLIGTVRNVGYRFVPPGRERVSIDESVDA